MSIPSGLQPYAPPPELNVRDALAVLRRRKGVFFQVFGMVLAVGIVAAGFSKPVYETYAKLLVAAGSSSVSIVDSNNPIATMLAAAQPDSVATQLQELQTAPFLDEAKRLAKVGQKPQVIAPSVRVEALEGTNIIRITVDGGDPEGIARLANTIVDLHLDRTDLLTTTGLKDTIQFVQKEKDKTGKSLADAETALLQFQRAHPGADLGGDKASVTANYAASLARVIDLESNIVTTKAETQSLEAQLAKAPQELLQETIKENLRVGEFQDRLDALQFQRLDLLREFRPASRQIQDLDRLIDRLKLQMSVEPREIRVLAHTLNPNRALLQTRLQELQAALQGYEKNRNAAAAQLQAQKQLMQNLGPMEARLGALTHNRDAIQAAYTLLSDRLRDLQLRASARLRTARVIERAAVPTIPIRPRKAQTVALAAILALLLATGAVFLQEYVDDRISSPEEVERLTGLPTMGQIPLMRPNQPHLVAQLPGRSHVAESYRALRSSVGFAGVDTPIRRLQITSSVKGEGKTTTAVNLATAMARDGKRVVLVDADLRSPNLHRLLNLPASPGLSEALIGGQSVDEVVQATEIEHLLLVSAGVIPPNPAELLGSCAFNRVIEQLEEQADVIIVDTPPCVPVTDPVLVAPRMDGVILVVHPGQTRKAAIKQVAELLGRARARILGVLFNQAEAHMGGYYYRYQDYYYSEDEGDRRDRCAIRRNGRRVQPELENGKQLAAARQGRDDEERRGSEADR